MHHFVMQTTSRDCGWACLKMILADMSHNEDYLTLPATHQKGPLSFLDLVSMASPFGLTLEGYKVISKKEVFSTRGVFIALIEHQGKTHYLIVDKVRAKKVFVRDPAQGVYSMRKSEFLEMFTGQFLIVTDWVKPQTKIKNTLGLPAKTRLALYGWQTLSAMTLLSGLASVNSGSHFALPIGLFAAYIVLELLYKGALLKAMVYLDKNYVIPKMKIVNKDFRVNLHFLYELKSALIVTPLSFITHLMTVIAFIAILGLNGWNNLILVGFVIAVLAVERLYWKPRQDQRARKIAEQEEGLIEGMTRNRLEIDVGEELASLNHQTYRYAMEDEVRKYLFWFALLAGVLISMGLTGNVSLNYLVFHFMALAFLSENIRSMMDFSKKQDKVRLLMNRYHGLK